MSAPAHVVAEAVVEEWSRPFARPVVTARGVLEQRQGWYVHLRTQTGLQATGECAALEGWSQATHEEAGEGLRRSAATLLGKSLDGLRVTTPVPEVQAGLHAALTGLRANAAGVPMAELLGATEPFDVEINSLLAGDGPDELRQSVAQAVSLGRTTHKLKVGLADDRVRLAAVIEAMPAGHRLRLDANRAWNVADAQRELRHIAETAGDIVEYLEDPVDSLEAFAELDLGVPLAADELLRSTADVRRAVVEGNVAALVVKPMLVGGIEPVLVWARQAHDASIPVVVSSAYETQVGLAHWQALAAALPGPRRAHGLADLLA